MTLSVKEIIMNIFFYFTEMDIPSQQKGYFYSQVLITSLSIIGFIIGFLKESFQIAVYFNLVGTILSVVLFVPAWPIWKKKRLMFLPTEKNKQKKKKKRD